MTAMNLPDEIKSAFARHFSMLSSIGTKCSYVIDVAVNQFCDIPSDNFFLCGYPAEVAIKMGFDFYSKILHPNDLSLWADMCKAVFQHLEDSEKKQGEEYYFSCTFRLQRKYSFLGSPLTQMIFHRMAPVLENGKLRYLACSVGSSTAKEAGNLRIYSKDPLTYEEYNFKTRRWKQQTIEPLTERERAILMLAQQGKTHKDIANTLHKGHSTICNQIKVLFSKLDVHTMQEAIEFAARHCMINPKQDLQQQPPIEVHPQRGRVLLTDDMKKRIQQYLDDGTSIRHAARLEGVTEGAIRYWIKQGKLKIDK